MRPVVNGEGVGGGNLTGKPWLESSAKELWEAWGIHFLILLSFSLQVFLYLAAGMRRWCTSLLLSKLLWLAYVSADSVAIFVLGHLAAHASGPSHHLMFFWTPFVLVHLGGQDTITAFSKQDNELWKRHLLNLVFQVGVAGYVVVAVASWPDARLRASMVLVFLSGCFKYAERTMCLFLASPARLRVNALHTISTREVLQFSVRIFLGVIGWLSLIIDKRRIIDMMKEGKQRAQAIDYTCHSTDIMCVDAPSNDPQATMIKNHLPRILEELLCSSGRNGAYEFVGACLVNCYRKLYTKNPVRSIAYNSFVELAQSRGVNWIRAALIVLYALFQYVSTTIALVLFWAAEKGDRASRADIVVSYMLLVGALVLDVSSATMSIFHNMPEGIVIKKAMLRVSNYIQPACSRKQWSDELAQYSMIKRHTGVPGNRGIASIKQWIDRRLSSWELEPLFDVTHVPITRDIKEFVLDELLRCGIRKEWDIIASSRGRLALRDDQGVDPWPGQATHKSTSRDSDFTISVLIWHIATDLCYWRDKASSNDDQMNKHKEMSRQLSNYIMYLVFKCNVMLSVHSQIVHNVTHRDIGSTLSDQVNPCEEEAIRQLWQNKAWRYSSDSPFRISVMQPALEVAQELMNIDNTTRRWGFIASVWSEMLYYIAPRCGSGFHYEHLCTGGEFATHVLFLMYSLGPFLPGPGA